jgi:hypothetical protein
MNATITSSAEQLPEFTTADEIIEQLAECRAMCLDDDTPADRVKRRRETRIRISATIDTMSEAEMRDALKTISYAVLLMA